MVNTVPTSAAHLLPILQLELSRSPFDFNNLVEAVNLEKAQTKSCPTQCILEDTLE
jgi:hypothetical protein